MEYHLLLARGMNGAGLGAGGVNWPEALIFHEKIKVLMDTTIILLNNKYYECLGPQLISILRSLSPSIKGF
jgi:hypothetical protein